jgi:pimeloyl-ACP methyl ester carboxylesterase
MIHGGPGSPYTPFNAQLGGWERELIVVQWDQRGSGHTWIKAGGHDGAPLTLDRLADDGIELAEQLTARFGRRVLLVGSSVGSLVSATMAGIRATVSGSPWAVGVAPVGDGQDRYDPCLVIDAV